VLADFSKTKKAAVNFVNFDITRQQVQQSVKRAGKIK
jgi:hypothetical protein